MKITVSGKTYYGAMDPLATDVPKQEGWPKPAWRAVGKGKQAIYEITFREAAAIAHHLEVLAYGFADSDSPEARTEGRAFAKDAERIRFELHRYDA